MTTQVYNRVGKVSVEIVEKFAAYATNEARYAYERATNTDTAGYNPADDADIANAERFAKLARVARGTQWLLGRLAESAHIIHTVANPEDATTDEDEFNKAVAALDMLIADLANEVSTTPTL